MVLVVYARTVWGGCGVVVAQEAHLDVIVTLGNIITCQGIYLGNNIPYLPAIIFLAVIGLIEMIIISFLSS